jgi:outer membrane lipoprotein-sorting protein
MDSKLHTYNNEWHNKAKFWHTAQTKLRIHNITLKATFRYGSEVWVFNKRENNILKQHRWNF